MLGAVMGRRKKLSSASIAIGTVRLVDRTAVEPNPKLDPVIVLTEGPDGQRAEHYRARRNDPLAQLLARHQIDEVEYIAGRQWQGAYERAELGGARAIDTTKEYVDGGSFPDPLSNSMAKALGDLRLAARAMGPHSESIVHDVLVRGWTYSQIAAVRGVDDEAHRREYGRVFREALKVLSVVFGLAMPSRSKM